MKQLKHIFLIIKFQKKKVITLELQQFVLILLKKRRKNHLQVYLEQCKYKIKRRKPVDFIDAEVDLSSSDTDE